MIKLARHGKRTMQINEIIDKDYFLFYHANCFFFAESVPRVCETILSNNTMKFSREVVASKQKPFSLLKLLDFFLLLNVGVEYNYLKINFENTRVYLKVNNRFIKSLKL